MITIMKARVSTRWKALTHGYILDT